MIQQTQEFDWVMIKGTIGVLMLISAPIVEYAGILGQLIGWCGGLLLLYLSIKARRLEIKHRQMLIDKEKK
jgi:adenylate cyclase